MHDAVFGFVGDIAARSVREWQHLQISPKALLVKSHGFTAVSVKDQVCVDFFHAPPQFLFSFDEKIRTIHSLVRGEPYVPNLSAARALAFAASSSRFLAGAVVS